MKRKRATKYLAFARIAFVQAATERSDVYGRMAFFAVILGVFTALWRAVGEAGMPLGASPRSLVWYLAATEWILLSAPQLHVEIQEDVRSGDVAYRLPRPVSYVGALFAQAAGMLAFRAPLLGVTAFVCAFAYTRQAPSALALLPLLVLGGWAAMLVSMLNIGVGLLAFWLTDVSPVYWIWQKLTFVLGGLMLPLALYPELLQRVASLTPFPSLLAGPAGLLLGFSPAGALTLSLRLGFWSIATALLTVALFRRAVRRVQIHGG